MLPALSAQGQALGAAYQPQALPLYLLALDRTRLCCLSPPWLLRHSHAGCRAMRCGNACRDTKPIPAVMYGIAVCRPRTSLSSRSRCSPRPRPCLDCMRVLDPPPSDNAAPTCLVLLLQDKASKAESEAERAADGRMEAGLAKLSDKARALTADVGRKEELIKELRAKMLPVCPNLHAPPPACRIRL